MAEEYRSEVAVDRTPSEPSKTAKRSTKARVACTVCHRRKVRCNVGLVGVPCSNCIQDKTSCVLHVSARGKHRRVRAEKNTRGDRPTVNATESQEGEPRRTEGASTSPKEAITLPLTPEDTATHRDRHVTWAEHVARPVQHEAHLESVFVEDFLRSWGFVAHDTSGNARARGPHLWIPRRARKHLSNAEMALLDEKQALQLPGSGFCEVLLEAYFAYVHPLLPVIEMASFWPQYELQQPNRVSTLLLQSMFLAASNYIPSEIYLAHGWSSAALLKECFYERAKALFDVGIEQDKVVLAQSAILMSYWYGNSDNIAVCWHWIGIACSLCQEMGLHRRPAPTQVPEARRRLWKRIWWCCYHRDRWIALGLGRPMRINDKDHDVEDLTLSDLEEEAQSYHGWSPTAIRTIKNYRPMARLFLQAASLSVCLGHIIASHFVPGPGTISTSRSAECEAKISNWYAGSETMREINHAQSSLDNSETAMLLKHTLNIFYQIVNIALHRSRLSPRYEASEDRNNIKAATNQCWNAASAATDSLRTLIDLDMASNLPPEMSTALVLITSVLFTQRSWTTGLREKVVKQKLDLCLMVLKELASKYFAAQSALAYFESAFAREGFELATQSREVLLPTPSLSIQDQEVFDHPLLYGSMDVAALPSGFLSPSKWLYDLSCAFPTGDSLPEHLELL